MSSGPLGSAGDQLIVICPVFNEEKTIPLFFERIRQVRDRVAPKFKLNLVFVDNHSTDSTPDLLTHLAGANPWVGSLRLSRNYGYQKSLESGLRSSFGDYYCFIDVDCEDPPEMLVDFVREIEAGHEIVFGERVDRVEPEFIKWMRKQYYKITKAAADEHFNLYMAEFSMFTRVVRDAIIRDNNSFPFLRASIGRVGFSQKALPYKRHPRVAGETHYNFLSMLSFGLAGILSSSTVLLRVTAYLLAPWFVLVNAAFGYFLYTGDVVYAWSGVWISLLYFGVALASLAIYVARTYKNTLFRPNYVVDPKRSNLRSFLRPNE